MYAHIDFYPCEDCKNKEVVMMCLKCNDCGRFNKEGE